MKPMNRLQQLAYFRAENGMEKRYILHSSTEQRRGGNSDSSAFWEN